MNICNGLAYMDISVPTAKEFSRLPHVVLTSNANFDHIILDSEPDNNKYTPGIEDIQTGIQNIVPRQVRKQQHCHLTLNK